MSVVEGGKSYTAIRESKGAVREGENEARRGAESDEGRKSQHERQGKGEETSDKKRQWKGEEREGTEGAAVPARVNESDKIRNNEKKEGKSLRKTLVKDDETVKI